MMMVSVFLVLLCISNVLAFAPRAAIRSSVQRTVSLPKSNGVPVPYGQSLVQQRNEPLRDILGLGPAEIAISLVVALVLFGPETLKSLSKDVGKAAAELKEIPKTFKEGMEEGAESAQVSKMKAIAAEKRKKRDEKLASASKDEDEEDEDE